MQRPEKPKLTGIHRSPNNRFAWDFGCVPSPQRTGMLLVPADLQTGGRHTQEAIPIVCDWCGLPHWPVWSILKGCCSEACRTQMQDYLNDRRTKAELLQQLTAMDDVTAQDVEEVLRELRDRLVEEQKENDRLRGELGKASVTS